MAKLEPAVLGLGKPQTQSTNDAYQQLLKHIELLKKVESSHIEVSITSAVGNSIMLLILEGDPNSKLKFSSFFFKLF